MFIVFTGFVVSLGLGACSNYAGKGGFSGENSKQVTQHTHLANKCIDAVSHAHIDGKKEHLHYFHYCDTKNKNPNAHSHSSPSAITGFIHHVHPNGENKHTHGK